MAQRINPPQRTQGDGMEKCESSSLQNKTTKDIQQNNDLIQIQTHVLNKPKKNPVLANLKPKEPKFVPYEPYKAAVKPIIPKKTAQKKKINLTDLISVPKEKSEQTIVLNDSISKDILDEETCTCPQTIDYISKINSYSKNLSEENKLLKDENKQLENQLKFQVQVNGELKNLLVAAMGEDMETRVHVLTEDKLHLAKALLSSAESLTTHQEQTEWLANQCEVWRSKFLASSVMVEELARWKAGLTQKLTEAQDALKKLLNELKIIQSNSVKTFNNLSFLKENFDLISRKNDNKKRNILDICSFNKKLSDLLVLQLLGREYKGNVDDINVCEPTASEQLGHMIITNPHSIHLVGNPDDACNAVVGAAFNLSGQMFLKNHPPDIQCCSHCSGEIKLL